MTQLRRDAAYIRTESHERTRAADDTRLSPFDERVCELLSSAHTVTSAAKALSESSDKSAAEWENRVAEAMQRLLQAERIQLSPDS